MVRQAHHDQLDLPLVLRLVEGCAPFKPSAFFEVAARGVQAGHHLRFERLERFERAS